MIFLDVRAGIGLAQIRSPASAVAVPKLPIVVKGTRSAPELRPAKMKKSLSRRSASRRRNLRQPSSTVPLAAVYSHRSSIDTGPMQQTESGVTMRVMRATKPGVSISERAKSDAENQVRNTQRQVDYDTKDFTIDYLVQSFRADIFYIPEYQRKFIWDKRRQTKFIESVILGLPIPFLFVAEMDDGRLEIVDGAQRIQTLEAFLNDDVVLTHLEKLPVLDGFRFSDLSDPQQRKFKNRALRLIVLDSTTSVDIRKDIFERINTGSAIAKPSEIRKGALGGPFYEMVQSCAAETLFRKLCPITDSVRQRGEGEELVLRFFVYADEYTRFRHDVARFIDDYLKRHKNRSDSSFKLRFDRMLRFVNMYFPHGFAKGAGAKTTPRVRFEAIAVGVHIALEEQPGLVPSSMEWLESEQFRRHTTTHASNSGPKLTARVEYVRDSLLGRG